MSAGVQTMIYPQLYRYILHPCVSWPGNPDMCGGLHTATGDLRFDSFLTQEDVVIMLIYEVRSASLCGPSCIPNVPCVSSAELWECVMAHGTATMLLFRRWLSREQCP